MNANFNCTFNQVFSADTFSCHLPHVGQRCGKDICVRVTKTEDGGHIAMWMRRAEYRHMRAERMRKYQSKAM
jgi:hypothetical protein